MIEENDRIFYLLASLPESFNVLVTALEANKAIPKMETVIQRLIHEKHKLKFKNTPEVNNIKCKLCPEDSSDSDDIGLVVIVLYQ